MRREDAPVAVIDSIIGFKLDAMCLAHRPESCGGKIPLFVLEIG
jgi:hypothetical protein